MKNSNNKAKIYFLLLAMEFFYLNITIFLNPNMINQKSYTLLCLSFLLAIVAFSTKLVIGLFASLFLVFAYGSLILYKAIFEGNFRVTFTQDYFWLLVFLLLHILQGI